jgi:hypothetical protein
MRIRKLPAVEKRVETGPIQFEGDWPGTFIRGDQSFFFANALSLLLKRIKDKPDYATRLVSDIPVKNLLKLLQSSDLNRRHRKKAQKFELPRDTEKYLEAIEKAHEDAGKSKLVFKSVNGRGQEFPNQ